MATKIVTNCILCYTGEGEKCAPCQKNANGAENKIDSHAGALLVATPSGSLQALCSFASANALTDTSASLARSSAHLVSSCCGLSDFSWL